MVVFPCAKLNLGLRILRKRSDGYHDIQTLFYPIPLFDVLEVVPTSGATTFDDGGWGGVASTDNLVMRAYRLMKKEVPSMPNVQVLLRKRIPVGAGLGGGSSDAAAMLRLLNEQFELNLSPETLHQIAMQLGADVPFFLHSTPHLGEGIGEQLTPFPQLNLTDWHFTLLFPGIHISTAEAYAGVTPLESGDDLREVLPLPVSEWRGKLENDFEKSIFPKHPQLADYKAKLYERGATYAAMTGSGSTLFALSPQPLELEELEPMTIHLTNKRK